MDILVADFKLIKHGFFKAANAWTVKMAGNQKATLNVMQFLISVIPRVGFICDDKSSNK